MPMIFADGFTPILCSSLCSLRVGASISDDGNMHNVMVTLCRFRDNSISEVKNALVECDAAVHRPLALIGYGCRLSPLPAWHQVLAATC